MRIPRTLLLNVSLLLGSTLLSLFLAELAARAVLPAPQQVTVERASDIEARRSFEQSTRAVLRLKGDAFEQAPQVGLEDHHNQHDKGGEEAAQNPGCQLQVELQDRGVDNADGGDAEQRQVGAHTPRPVHEQPENSRATSRTSTASFSPTSSVSANKCNGRCRLS